MVNKTRIGKKRTALEANLPPITSEINKKHKSDTNYSSPLIFDALKPDYFETPKVFSYITKNDRNFSIRIDDDLKKFYSLTLEAICEDIKVLDQDLIVWN